MNKTTTIVTILALVVGLVAGYAIAGITGQGVGGPTTYSRTNLVGDLHSGMQGVRMISDGELVGPINTSEEVTLSGDVRTTNLTRTGQISVSTSTTLTASEVCNNSTIVSNVIASKTVTLPTATNLFADCLTSNGDRLDLMLYNVSSAASTTVIAAGASSTLKYSNASSTATIPGGAGATVSLIRTAADAIIVMINTFQ